MQKCTGHHLVIVVFGPQTLGALLFNWVGGPYIRLVLHQGGCQTKTSQLSMTSSCQLRYGSDENDVSGVCSGSGSVCSVIRCPLCNFLMFVVLCTYHESLQEIYALFAKKEDVRLWAPAGDIGLCQHSGGRLACAWLGAKYPHSVSARSVRVYALLRITFPCNGTTLFLLIVKSANFAYSQNYFVLPSGKI